MSDNHDLFEVLAARGEPRGAGPIYAEARRAMTRRNRMPFIAAGLFVVLAGAVAAVSVLGGDDGTTVVANTSTTSESDSAATTGPDQSSATTSSPAAKRPEIILATGSQLIALSDGIERVVAELGQGTVHRVDRDDDGATIVAEVHSEARPCRSDVAIAADGGLEVIRAEARLPAVHGKRPLLAYQRSGSCAADDSPVVVSDIDSGVEVTVIEFDRSDGLPQEVRDIAWVGDQLAVLIAHVDGEHASTELSLFEVSSDGTMTVAQIGGVLASDVTNSSDFANWTSIGEADGTLYASRTSSTGTGPVDLVAVDVERQAVETIAILDSSIAAFDVAPGGREVLYVAASSEDLFVGFDSSWESTLAGVADATYGP